MIDILKISSALLLIVVLTMRKVNLGAIMFMSTALVGILYHVTLSDMAMNVVRTATDGTTLTLIAALTFIRGFEYILRKRGILAGMMDTVKALSGGHRVTIASMPALIGMLPSVGGALFSAPMVEETTKGLGVSQERKTYLNYWFRHPWEFILPLYPGIVLAGGVTQIPMRSLIVYNIPLALTMFLAGSYFGLRGITPAPARPADGGRLRGARAFVPLVTLLLFVMGFHLGLLEALLLELIFVFLWLRSPLKEIGETLKESVSWEIIILIFGTILFKTTLDMSGGIARLSAYFTEHKVPLMPLLFFLPCLTGALTGFTVGFVGATFPLLLSLSHGDILPPMAFAFCSGYVGVLLSPVHLCLVLTRQYFNADMGRVYRRIIPSALITLAVGALQYMIFSR